MFAVVVTLQVAPGSMEAFLPAMLQNAAASLADEPDCHRFDVCTDPARPDEVLLYELYTDADAFQTHLTTAHFKAFDAQVAPMQPSKELRTFASVHP